MTSSLRCHCSKCRGSTKHIVLEEVNRSFHRDDEEMADDWAEGCWQIIECAGCETVSFREVWVSSGDLDPASNECVPTETLHPARSEADIETKSFLSIPPRLDSLYRETVGSLNAGWHLLCAAGLRALVEGICDERGVKSGHVERLGKTTKTLEGKIEGLREKGVLSGAHAETLHANRFMGNAALHELERPSREELLLGLEIAEHTLQNLYDLASRGALLEMRRKARK